MDLAELIDSVNIVEYIEQYVELEEKNGELWGISPFTFPPEKTPSFSVRPETGKFYCFSSGIGGSVLTFIQHYNRVSMREAVDILKKYAGVDGNVDSDAERRKRLDATSVCRAFKLKNASKKAGGAPVLPDEYMDRYENRPDKLQIWRDEGISDEAMQFFGVKYDRFSNRIVYPIRNIDGKIVNVGGRTLDPDFKAKRQRKYTYFKKWEGALDIVYGLYENKDSILQSHEVILFEGMKSVLLARGFGFKNTGAILTSHLNPSQMKVLAKLGVNVVFALDEEVDPTADRNIQRLRRYVNVSYIFDFKRLLQAKDAPVDRGEAVFRTLYNECRYKL